jgi:hypothetical protein
MNNNNNINSDKSLAAVCGLFCPSCTVYIATHEDPERLKILAERFGLPPEELMCDGCRAERRSFYCRGRCHMAKCAAGKGIDFCGGCDEFPCDNLKEFQSQLPHRIELWDSLKRIDEAGWGTWFAEQTSDYSCDCGTINSAYDFECRECGAEPSCGYVKKHKDTIEKGGARLRHK